MLKHKLFPLFQLAYAHKMLEIVTINESNESSKNKKKIINYVEIFSKLLLTHAQYGNLKEIDNLFKMIRRNDMQPNINSYTARIAAIGQIKYMKKRLNVSSQVIRTIMEMESYDVINFILF